MSNENSLEQNIKYLQRTVPPDDIYLFAEMNYSSSVYILKKLNELIEIENEMDKDEIFNRIVRNMVFYHRSRIENKDISINLRGDDSY